MEGTDLSIRFSDVQNMTVAGEQCDVVESGYRVSTRFVFFVIFFILFDRLCNHLR